MLQKRVYFDMPALEVYGAYPLIELTWQGMDFQGKETIFAIP
jgi:hypothetical protein